MIEIQRKIEENFKNEYNSIPVGFERLAKGLPGIIRGIHVAITGGTDDDKTKFLSYFFIINSIDEVKKVNDSTKLDIKIFLYLLNTNAEKYKARLLSAFLYRDYLLDIPYIQLLSIVQTKDRKMNRDILDKIAQYDSWFDYFKTKVELIETKRKPSDVYTNTKNWIMNNGTLVPDESGNERFVYNNPNLFVMSCVDSVNSFAADQDKQLMVAMDLRKCIEKHVTSNMNELKNKFNVCIVDIHDQAMETEQVKSDFSGKTIEKKLEPSLTGLGDSKTVGRLYDVVIGLFNPFKYEINYHYGYDIIKLKDNYRSVSLVWNSLGPYKVQVAYWYNAGASTFEEMPRSKIFENPLELEKYIKKQVDKIVDYGNEQGD